MKLYIKQKVFSFNDSFVVKDEFGNDKYHVEGEIFSMGHKLHVYDRSNNEVAFIKQKLLTFMPRFEIYADTFKVGELVKKLTFFKPSYYIEGSNLSLEGHVWEHDYKLYDGNSVIMEVYKEWFTWGVSYVLDIADPKDELLCLAVVLAVDCENCSSGNK